MKKNTKILLFFKILILFFLIGLSINYIFNKSKFLNKETQIIKEMNENLQTSNLEAQITELNTSHTEYANYVQNCKQTIATAITNQGVETSIDDTVEVMAENIEEIANIKYNQGYNDSIPEIVYIASPTLYCYDTSVSVNGGSSTSYTINNATDYKYIIVTSLRNGGNTYYMWQHDNCDILYDYKVSKTNSSILAESHTYILNNISSDITIRFCVWNSTPEILTIIYGIK